MFKENLKGIIQNLPLVLSDTTEVKDVSLNRLIIVLLTVLSILIALYSVFFDKSLLPLLAPFATPFFIFFGGLLGANVAKKFVPMPGQKNETTQGPSN